MKWSRKAFVENEKELESLKHALRIYSQDVVIELGIEKGTMLIMKSEKLRMTEGMEQPNQDKIRMLEETYKSLRILKPDTIK